MDQLRLTRPNRRAPNTARMTERQDDVLNLIRARTADSRHPYRGVFASELQGRARAGYIDPVAALKRLERRGLIYRVRGRGLGSLWRARINSERPA